jgi:phytoene dehydrogenase-like protein
MQKTQYDAVVVGAGPNGLAAAIVLAQKKWSVLVVEAEPTIGGGMRSAELTLPGFVHDICSAIHPMAHASPFFRTLPLATHGLQWIDPPAALAHPLDDRPAAILERSIVATARGLGADGENYRKLMEPLVERARDIFDDLLGPPRVPRHPWADLRFGLKALRSGRGFADRYFQTDRARALFAGLAAHSTLPLEQPPSAAVGLILTMAAHTCGWPFPRGGSQRIADALGSYFQSLGGTITMGTRVENVDQLPPSRAIFLDVTPRQVLRLAGHRLPGGYLRSLERYRYGPGAFKVDWALDGPIPWKDPTCAQAATVHLGGTLDEIAASEAAAWAGQPSHSPFVLVAQQSLFDPSRAPPGKHTAWAYCHVPNSSTCDMLPWIEAQLERFAPSFRERILARNVLSPGDLEHHNANYIGGDINGGVQDFRQLFARPIARWTPYRTAARGIYLCSSSTPPGGGVHGMCGYFAARAALRDCGDGRSREP